MKRAVNEAKENEEKRYEQIATHVSVVSIVWNLILSVCKLLAGIFAHSGAMISDAVHSASDVFSSVVDRLGCLQKHFFRRIRKSGRPRRARHAGGTPLHRYKGSHVLVHESLCQKD